MTEQTEVAARVRKIIAEHLGAEADRVVDTAALVDIGADSLDRVELLMAFEEEFTVHIDDDDAEQAGTVGECTAVVERAIAKKAAAA